MVRSTVDEQREFSASQAQIIQQQIQRKSSPHQLQHQVACQLLCQRLRSSTEFLAKFLCTVLISSNCTSFGTQRIYLFCVCKFWKHRIDIFCANFGNTIYHVRHQQQLRLAQQPLIVQQLEDQLKVRPMQIRGGHADFRILVSAYFSSHHSPAPPCSPLLS